MVSKIIENNLDITFSEIEPFNTDLLIVVRDLLGSLDNNKKIIVTLNGPVIVEILPYLIQVGEYCNSIDIIITDDKEAEVFLKTLQESKLK